MFRPLLLRVALAFGPLAACLPTDDTTERGAIHVRLEATSLKQVAGTYVVEFETLNMIVSGDVLNCHSIYYVDRPKSSVALVSLLRPHVFEHRSLTDESCGVLGGYANPGNVQAWVADGVEPAERERLMPGGVGVVGTAHIVAQVRWVPSPEVGPPQVLRRFDLLLRRLEGAAVRPAGLPVPHGGKAEQRVTLDMAPLAYELMADLRWDRDKDGTITNEELPEDVAKRVREAASNKWAFAEVTITK